LNKALFIARPDSTRLVELCRIGRCEQGVRHHVWAA